MKQDTTVFLLGGFGVQKPGENAFFQLEIIDLSSVEDWVVGSQKVTYFEPDMKHFKNGNLQDGKQFFNLNIASGLYLCDLLQTIKRDRASGLTLARLSLKNLRPHPRDVNAWFNYLLDVNALGNTSGLNVSLNGDAKVNGNVVTGIAPPKTDRMAELMK